MLLDKLLVNRITSSKGYTTCRLRHVVGVRYTVARKESILALLLAITCYAVSCVLLPIMQSLMKVALYC